MKYFKAKEAICFWHRLRKEGNKHMRLDIREAYSYFDHFSLWHYVLLAFFISQTCYSKEQV